MDWELSIKHMISGFIPVAAVLALYFLLLMRKRQKIGHLVLSCVFCFYLTGILTMTGI